jgi:hypothetical protein
VISESPADEAAVRILVEGILEKTTETILSAKSRPGGWTPIPRILPAVLRELYYHTDAEALVLVVDSNHSPAHQATHDQPSGAHPDCRLCILRDIAAQVQRGLRPRAGRASIRTAIGLAVPAIEAWYCCGADARVTEAAWINALQSGQYPYTKIDLKRAVYNSERYSLERETTRATEEARRLVQNLDLLGQMFPAGFGAIAREVRSWPAP